MKFKTRVKKVKTPENIKQVLTQFGPVLYVLGESGAVYQVDIDVKYSKKELTNSEEAIS